MLLSTITGSNILKSPRARRVRTTSMSQPNKRTTAESILHADRRTIYTAGRPPWYNCTGGQEVEPFLIGKSTWESKSRVFPGTNPVYIALKLPINQSDRILMKSYVIESAFQIKNVETFLFNRWRQRLFFGQSLRPLCLSVISGGQESDVVRWVDHLAVGRMILKKPLDGS